MKAPLGYARRSVCGLLLLAQAACATAPHSVGAPTPYLQANSPKRIWVTLASGEHMVIDRPRVFGDTLLGFTQKAGRLEEVWLPLLDLQDVKARRFSGGRTALTAGLIGAAVGLILFILPNGAGAVKRPCMNEGEPC